MFVLSHLEYIPVAPQLSLRQKGAFDRIGVV
jgi:hypothetical protein